MSSLTPTSGSTSSLGIGSGILTQSVIDQLKAADVSAQIKPITTNISKTQEKQTALTSLQSLMTGVSSLANTFSDQMTYLNRAGTSSSSDVSMSVLGGTNIQSATINVSKLAQNDIWESQGFAYSTSLVNSSGSAQNLTLKVGSTTQNINVSANANVQDLADAINSSAGSLVTASVVNTGNATNPYRLVIKGDSTGSTSNISLTDTGLNTGFNTSSNVTGSAITAPGTGSLVSGDIMINGTAVPAATISSSTDMVNAINSVTSKTGVTASYNSGTGQISLATADGLGNINVTASTNATTLSGLSTTSSQGTHLQTAQDAAFTYNGMNMTRKTNTITDITQGLTLTLNNANSQNINLGITQDLSTLGTTATSFVTAYNSMQTQLSALTKYTAGSTSQGIFVGTSQVSQVESNLTNAFTQSVSVSGKSYSLMDFGFSMDKTGQMSLDNTVFNNMVSSNPDLLQKVFSGNTTYTDNTYTANMAASVPATDTTSSINDVSINGIALPSVTSLASNTAIQNAQLFADAINKITSQTGATAAVDSSGHIKLSTVNGGQISVQTSLQGATLTGLSSDSTSASAMSSSLVAIGSSKTTDGIFKKLSNAFDSLSNTKLNGSLDLYSQQLTSDVTNYTTQQTKTQQSIDDRYAIMQKQFQMYDNIIAQLKQKSAQFTSMTSSSNSSSSG